MVLLSHPTPVLTIDLATRPLALQGQAKADVTLCDPTPVLHFAQTGACHTLGSTAEKQEGSCHAANCIVHWFEADCGEAGWLSTGPGHTYYGHWTQSVDFMAEPLELAGEEQGKSDAAATAVISASFALDRVKLRAQMQA